MPVDIKSSLNPQAYDSDLSLSLIVNCSWASLAMCIGESLPIFFQRHYFLYFKEGRVGDILLCVPTGVIPGLWG